MTDFRITNPDIHAYLEAVRPPSDSVLQEMEKLAVERGFPYLGAQCSRLLYVLVRSLQARRIFELGSGFGYTMYWMARAIEDGGIVIGTENDAKNVAEAKDFFARGGLTDRTDIRLGDALELFATEQGPLDLVFCDIDKHDYPRAFEMAKPRLRDGGLFVADNLLRGGRIVDPESRDDATEGVRRFTEHIHNDPDFLSVIVPMRDGMSISVKIS